ELGLSVGRDLSVLAAILERERSYWRITAQARRLEPWASDRILARVVAFATLIGAGNENAGTELLKRIPELADVSITAIRDLARWCHEAYIGSEWLVGLQHSMLSDELIGQVFEGSPDLANCALEGLDERRAMRALTMLNRSAARRPG